MFYVLCFKYGIAEEMWEKSEVVNSFGYYVAAKTCLQMELCPLFLDVGWACCQYQRQELTGKQFIGSTVMSIARYGATMKAAPFGITVGASLSKYVTKADNNLITVLAGCCGAFLANYKIISTFF